MTMAKVYVSSTIADLKAERQAVFDWLAGAKHQYVHSYRPDSETVTESCGADVDECDLYVLILGHRYGWQPGLKGIPRVALLRVPIPDPELSDVDDPVRSELVRRFKAEVRGAVRAGEFRDIAA